MLKGTIFKEWLPQSVRWLEEPEIKEWQGKIKWQEHTYHAVDPYNIPGKNIFYTTLKHKDIS